MIFGNGIDFSSQFSAICFSLSEQFALHSVAKRETDWNNIQTNGFESSQGRSNEIPMGKWDRGEYGQAKNSFMN